MNYGFDDSVAVSYNKTILCQSIAKVRTLAICFVLVRARGKVGLDKWFACV